MKGTRGEIVALLRERGECTVADLAEAIGIAPAALRRHLEILAGEGAVEYRAVKQSTGRPYFAYRLTEQAREAAVNDYPRLLERLVTEVTALDRSQTADKDGRELLATVFANMTKHVAADYQSRIRGETLEERVASVTEALREEGIVERWSKQPDGFHLATSICPHRRVALATHGLCDSEARLIATLLGAEVEQVGRVVDGAPACEYVVKSYQLSAISGQPEATAEGVGNVDSAAKTLTADG